MSSKIPRYQPPSPYTPLLRRFTDERARDLAETIVLYDEVRRAHLASPWSADDAIDQVNSVIAERVAEFADIPDSGSLLRALDRCQKEVLALETTIFSCPEIRWDIAALSLQEQVDLRRFLRAQQHFLANQDRVGTLLATALTDIFSGIIKELPALPDRANDAVFSVPLISLVSDPNGLVDCIIGTIWRKELADAGLFTALQDRLWRNVCLASGVSPDVESKKSLTTANESDLEPIELVETYLRGTPFRDLLLKPMPFVIPEAIRFEHMHIVAGSGHGKTQLMQLLIHRELEKAVEDGRSIIVIDSQGDMIRTISGLALFKPGSKDSLADRLVIVDPNDIEYPACLNMFDWNRERLSRYGLVEREKLLNSTIELYEYLFGALLGAELTQRQGVIFRYIARLMMEIPDATIQTLRELMESGERFRPYMQRLPGSARSFFETRFFDRSFNETKKQILTRLWGVLSNATLERMFSHPKNKLDMYEAINSGTIILVDTAKDLLKQEGCAIFGRFFISLITQATLERASLAPDDRRSVSLYIDEAQDYFDDNIEHLLNQARKYRLGMVFAHQNLDQLSPGLRSSVMASTSIKLAGGTSAKDARALAEEMRCEAGFIQETRKSRGHTEFACYVRNLTARAIKVSVPLGVVESQPALTGEERQALIDLSRARCAVHIDEAFQDRPAIAEVRVSEAVPIAAEPEEIKPEPPNVPQAPVVELPQPTPEPAPPRLPARAVLSEFAEPPAREGREHTYVQHLLKLAGQKRGYLAVVEEPILGGTGKVDVSLTKGSRRIACEISVTTSKEWELGNVQKCLAAGYDPVIFVSAEERHRKAVEAHVAARIDKDVSQRVLYLTPDAAVAYLDELDEGLPPTEETVRGYRVKVSRGQVDHADAERRREAIAEILVRSLKAQRPK